MQVTISYQTLHLPPPYAFAYTLRLDFLPEALQIDFQLEYLNRSALTEEEILDEGYSLDDSFQWNGTLDLVWSRELKPAISETDLQEETEEDINIWIHFDVANEKKGLVTNPDEWEYRLQEVIQAIYEKAGHEKPLQMKFVDRQSGKRTFYELTGSFASRQCIINKKSISWQQMQSLMSEVFSMDFEGEWSKNPEDDGLWIDPDGLSGYQAVHHQMSGKKAQVVKNNILKILRSTE